MDEKKADDIAYYFQDFLRQWQLLKRDASSFFTLLSWRLYVGLSCSAVLTAPFMIMIPFWIVVTLLVRKDRRLWRDAAYPVGAYRPWWASSKCFLYADLCSWIPPIHIAKTMAESVGPIMEHRQRERSVLLTFSMTMLPISAIIGWSSLAMGAYFLKNNGISHLSMILLGSSWIPYIITRFMLDIYIHGMKK